MRKFRNIDFYSRVRSCVRIRVRIGVRVLLNLATLSYIVIGSFIIGPIIMGSNSVLAQDEGVAELDDGSNLRFFGVDFGLVEPIGSAEFFYLPNALVSADGAPEAYSDFYDAGITTNFYAGIINDEGFEISISFKITKVNYSNHSEGIIQKKDNDITRSGVYSSYLLGSQVYMGQRISALWAADETLYFGVAGDFSSLKHYSEQSVVPEDQTLGLSFIAGEEVTLFRDRSIQAMFTFRVQLEFVALASSERPRYVGLTFGIRQYFR